MRILPNVRDKCTQLEWREVEVDENARFERTRVELEINIGTMLK